MTVIIGIDPHRASHAAVAIGCDEQPLAEISAVEWHPMSAPHLAVGDRCRFPAMLRHNGKDVLACPDPGYRTPVAPSLHPRGRGRSVRTAQGLPGDALLGCTALGCT